MNSSHLIKVLPAAAAAALLMVAGTAQAEGPPFMKDLAADRGETLPMPYGLALVYSNTKQDLQLDNLDVTANGNPTSASSLLHLGRSDIKASTVLLKGDVWLLPFLDVFAFVGQASNKLKVDYSVNGAEVADYYGSTACDDPSDRPAFCERNFTGTIDRDTDAVNYGGGALLAIANGPAFALMGLIYAKSDASDGDTKVETFTASPRAGWRFATASGGSVAVYGGASFVDSKVELSSQQVFATGAPAGGNVPQEVVLDYSVSQKNEDDWSYLAGVNWDISRRWTLQGEYALGAREGLLTSLVWRFGG
ncbi:outer membrane beta-barrel protein [Hydrocarboniphaga sp.]|uniref:outer membrane beta-barrel protein n=1 Tax=Hydrocarboniphaga sp. TaxID=2033016 RepID=UPI003D0F2014